MESGDVFTLSRIYEAEGILKKLHPNNNHIRAKIRQQLQILQEFGYLEFIDNKGHYKVIKSLTSSNWQRVQGLYFYRSPSDDLSMPWLNDFKFIRVERYDPSKRFCTVFVNSLR